MRRGRLARRLACVAVVAACAMVMREGARGGARDGAIADAATTAREANARAMAMGDGDGDGDGDAIDDATARRAGDDASASMYDATARARSDAAVEAAVDADANANAAANANANANANATATRRNRFASATTTTTTTDEGEKGRVELNRRDDAASTGSRPRDRGMDFALLEPPATTFAGLAIDDDEPKWMRQAWKDVSADALDDAAKMELGKKMEHVPEELRRVGAKAGGEMFVTFGTASVQDFVFNWAAAAKKLSLEPIFVGALDEEMHTLCVKAGIPSMLLTGRSVLDNRDQEFITQKSKTFKKMGTVKTKFIQDLLELGIAPILSDADVVWMRDPRELFNNGTYAYADVLISSDCIDTVNDRADNANCRNVNFNTGIVHIRPTEPAKAFVEKWKQKVATSEIAWMRDQPALNLLVREGSPALAPAVAVPDDKRGLPGYRSIVFAANSTIRMGVLPIAQFSNGHTFFVQEHHLYHPEDGEPYAVHTTYQYGDSARYAYGKRQRLRQHGLWYADDDTDYWKPKKYLTISTKGSQMKFNGSRAIGMENDAYLTAITRHFEEDRLRRTTIRNGFALAKALGRIFVLPPARCYCDKIWNTLAGCRALGAETAHLPYACPMDHIYNLEGLHDLGVDFREAGFLEDMRLKGNVREDVIHVKIGAKDDKNMADVVIERGFSASDAVEALESYNDHGVIMIDQLDEGSFCGFDDKQKDEAFDTAINNALNHDQYFCFNEAYDKQGRPRSGGGKDGKEYEPRVVERHCGIAEGEQSRLATRGVVTEVLKDPITCSCEWAYKLPKALADTRCAAQSRDEDDRTRTGLGDIE